MMGADDRNQWSLSMLPAGGSLMLVVLIAGPFLGRAKRAPAMAGTAKSGWGFEGRFALRRLPVGAGQLSGYFAQQDMKCGLLRLIQGRKDRFLNGIHRGFEAADQRRPSGRGVDVLASFIAGFTPAFDETACFKPLQKTRNTGRCCTGCLGNVALDGAGVFHKVTQDEALRVAEVAFSDPVLAALHQCPSNPSEEAEAA